MVRGGQLGASRTAEGILLVLQYWPKAAVLMPYRSGGSRLLGLGSSVPSYPFQGVRSM